MPFEYTKKVMKHFMHPKNVGIIRNADGIGKMISPVCGDSMLLYIKVKDNKIKDIKFKTFGCTAAIASSSILTEIAKGKTIKEAEKITKKDIVRSLGGLPYKKIHCSVLAVDALHAAIKDYKKKRR
jgi:nitrogen fixation NifU-like protein